MQTPPTSKSMRPAAKQECIFLGWPFIIVLLILSYLYGVRRLSRTGGPSVKEIKDGKDPLWEGQQRGF
ncbi:MAG: hypothetical protein A2Z16_17630 [Chloroflexi bacterium RBG_16_54_18]|nr:MAG: hypothetical protein A2Z16_17630 [Chloroflexi bacterium RBG_16_54_18]